MKTNEQTKETKKRPAPAKKKLTAAEREFLKAFTPNKYGEYA